MKILFYVLSLVVFASTSFAGDEGDDMAIRRCLKSWGKKAPFNSEGALEYDSIGANVQVFGLGDDIADQSETAKPKLVLVKPSVNVMGGTVMKLLNPNGWYCLKANVTVMAKTTIQLACNASIADSRDGVSIASRNDHAAGRGVTVMGKTTLQRIGCKS